MMPSPKYWLEIERSFSTLPVSSTILRIDEAPSSPVLSYRKPSRRKRPSVKALGSWG
jgi:hypothetical protein